VPARYKGFTLKADTSWRKGDPSMGRDPRKVPQEKDWHRSVYPEWWGEANCKDLGYSNHYDELDLKC
jgi:hypothetical protein